MRKSAPMISCLVYYESPHVISFKTNVDDASTITVGVLVVLLAETRGRQAASEVVLLAQDLGNTLTAAPVSIK